MWKWILMLVILAALAGGGWLALGSQRNQGDAAGGAGASGSRGGWSWSGFGGGGDKVTEVRIEPVVRGTLVRSVSAPGSVEPKTNVQISAQISARIIALPFEEGADVQRGDVVVRLDAESLTAQLASVEAQLRGEEARLDGARAAFIEAESAYKRAQELYEAKVISKQDLDQSEASYLRARSSVRVSEHQIEIAKANIDRVQKDLDDTVIKSPIDGTITRLPAEVGELVVVGTLNNAGSVIMEIADLSKMLVKARVDEANVGPVRSGQRAQISINAYRDRVFTGTVERVELKRQTDRDGTGFFTTEILIDLPPGERLLTGLTSNVDIEVESLDSVLKIPSQAVVDRRVDELPKEQSARPEVDSTKVFARVVYAIRDGKAVSRPVTVGSSDLTHTVIVSGLAEGDKVITGPFKVLVNLKDGDRVAEEGTLKNEGAESADEQIARDASSSPTPGR